MSKIRKFNESSTSLMTSDKVYCVYDSNEQKIVELYLNESESKSRADQLDKEFNIDMNNRVKDSLGSRPPLKFSRYFSYSLSKAIQELEDYWSDYYSEHDESY
jgi:hypothetical protein